MTTLHDILKNFLPSNEIKNRIKNGQLKLNNEIITVEQLKEEIQFNNSFWEYDDFIYNWMKTLNTKQIELVFLFKGSLEDFFGPEPSNIKTLNFLTGFSLLSLSKKEKFVFINK